MPESKHPEEPVDLATVRRRRADREVDDLVDEIYEQSLAPFPGQKEYLDSLGANPLAEHLRDDDAELPEIPAPSAEQVRDTGARVVDLASRRTPPSPPPPSA